eukprot:CAMPEP_0174960418 /NCGR_PEP_ID=MMETSP0004_2-20121128/3695_1 /TAXON_ID=420556 /ORGANISM="Ochromonas sp., Strain CCMP1393" /LENGTH=277 /DNA_ID=CAMNT_0016208793 /DNA_START=226 /DNA_END=1056 /DNA_ORIENTATION=-
MVMIYIGSKNIHLNTQKETPKDALIDRADPDIQTLLNLNSTLIGLRNELVALRGQKSQLPHIDDVKSNVSIRQLPSHNRITPATGHVTKISKTAVIFTMDSIESYEKNSLAGGAAGELTIRRSLEHAFGELGVTVKVLKSDTEFNKCDLNKFDIIILDPWTWAARGWVPKRNLVGQESKVYILDFFGSKGLRGKGMAIPMNRFLTAFGSPMNSFLGYFMETGTDSKVSVKKEAQGVIWGKDVKHFHGKEQLLKSVASSVTLISTASSKVFNHHNIKW